MTAVEVMPIHYHIDDDFLVEKGRINYWGYNTLGYFAPDPRYAAAGPLWAAQEFKSMVRTLHSEGVEVIRDLVSYERKHLNWELMLDTSSPRAESRILKRLESYPLEGRSLAVLRPEFPAG